jgi:mRNA interferase RelE/StbE
MPEYALRFARAARRELEALDTMMVRRLFPAIESLAREPRPRGCRKVQGADKLWRIRVGDYRVLYTIDDQTRIIDILAIRHRSDADR